MTAADEAAMRGWHMTAFLADPRTKADHAALVRLLKPYGPRPLVGRVGRVVAGVRRRLRG